MRPSGHGQQSQARNCHQQKRRPAPNAEMPVNEQAPEPVVPLSPLDVATEDFSTVPSRVDRVNAVGSQAAEQGAGETRRRTPPMQPLMQEGLRGPVDRLSGEKSPPPTTPMEHT